MRTLRSERGRQPRSAFFVENMPKSNAVPVCNVVQDLIEAGVVPADCRRVIIDFQVGEVVRVYYDVFGNVSVVDLITKLVRENKLPKIGDEGSEAV